MAFIVVYDANVLLPVRLRDLLLRIAEAGIVRARWSEQILDEWQSALSKLYPDIPSEKFRLQRALMVEAVPDCIVSNYAGLANELDLVDEKDHYVVATAVRAQAQLIVTYNLKHFPEHALAKYDIEVKHPDEFVLDAIDLFPGRVANIIHSMSADLHKPPRSVEQVLETLQSHQLTQSVAKIRGQLAG